jgi:pectate lyase
VNNYYLPGPATRVFHLLKPDAGRSDDPQQYYLSGNMMVGRPQYDADNWAGAIVDPRLLSQIRLAQPFCEPHVATHTAEEAYASVMADVGANWPRLDAVDQRIVNDVLTRQASAVGSRGKLPGIIDSQADVGGWPELVGGEAPVDTDHDGMPDAWESAHGSNPRDAADGSRVASSGYTLLEEYLNQIVANR